MHNNGGHAGPGRLQFLLSLSSAQYDKLEKSLEKTGLAHVVIAGIGIAMVIQVANVSIVFAVHFLGEYDLKTIAAILLAIHLYYFMRTGPLLILFNEVKELRDGLLKEYLVGQPEVAEVDSLRRTTSFLGAAFYSDTEYLPYFIIMAVAVSLAQAAAVFLVVKAYHASAMIGLVIAVPSILILYFMFWRAQKTTRATLAVGALCALVIIWFLLFLQIAPVMTGPPPEPTL